MNTLSDSIELCARRALDNPARAKEALAWYAQSQAYLESIAAGYPLETVAAFFAVLSPQVGWDEQIRFHTVAWQACVAAGPSAKLSLITGPGLPANKAKALRIFKGESPATVLGGDKVKSFFANLTGCQSEVTVDRHALAIAYAGDPPATLTSKRYKLIRDAHREVGARLGYTAAGIQALTWVYWREVKNGRDWL